MTAGYRTSATLSYITRTSGGTHTHSNMHTDTSTSLVMVLSVVVHSIVLVSVEDD